MNVPPDREPLRAFPPGRIAAFVLVAAAAAGLVALRFAPHADPVSVPAGATAGDVILGPCDYETEDGSYAADCGTLVVPENRADPESRLIGLPVTRIRARSDDPGEPIFRLEGGPGLTNMEFERASRFAGDHDVVLVGYRGVDGSVRLDCPEVESALARSTDLLGETSLRAYAEAYRACAGRLAEEGIDVTQYGLVQQADDLEAARAALGYDRIDLLSESAGTRTAMIYAWRHPSRVHRSVMIGANPPGNFLWDPATTDELIGRYAALCAKDVGCSERTDDLAASMRETGRRIPDRWLFLPIEEGNVRVASFLGLAESRSEGGPVSAPRVVDAWLSAEEGDASGLWFASLAGDLLFPELVVWGQYAAAGSLDADAARSYFSPAGPELDGNLGAAATGFLWGGGRLADAWPAAAGASEYARVRRSDVETLLIGGELDFATPPQVATKELLPRLPNGRQVVLPGLGHTVDFWTSQPEAGTRLITAFLERGRVDRSLYTRARVDLTPTVGHGLIAKIVLGATLPLAALTVLSLAWILLRVRWRGPFGPKAAAALRTLFAALLGLGGWLVGALIVLSVLPGVPVTDDLLVALSVGAPVGLGLYLAWVDPGWSAATKAMGFAAAAGGALLGARLGLDGADGILAVLTAGAGSVVGGNLLLLALDVALDRQLRERVAAASGGAARPWDGARRRGATRGAS